MVEGHAVMYFHLLNVLLQNYMIVTFLQYRFLLLGRVVLTVVDQGGNFFVYLRKMLHNLHSFVALKGINFLHAMYQAYRSVSCIKVPVY